MSSRRVLSTRARNIDLCELLVQLLRSALTRKRKADRASDQHFVSVCLTTCKHTKGRVWCPVSFGAFGTRFSFRLVSFGRD